MKFLIELGGRCCWPKQRPKLCSIFLSFIGLWVKIWHRNKTTYSKLNPVQTLQSSRSKSMTCLKEENLLRFKLNSTETSNDCAQKLGNDVCRRLVWFWIDCNQSLQPNQWQMKCNLLQERVSAQIRIKQHRDTEGLQMAACKSLEQDSESLSKVCSPISSKWNAKCESHVVTCINNHCWSLIWKSSNQWWIWRFFWAICVCKQSSAVLLTNHP